MVKALVEARRHTCGSSFKFQKGFLGVQLENHNIRERANVLLAFHKAESMKKTIQADHVGKKDNGNFLLFHLEVDIVVLKDSLGAF